MQSKRFAIILSMVLVAFGPVQASAEEEVQRSHVFSAENIKRLQIEHRVGSIRLEEHAGSEIEVEVTIRDDKNSRWFSRSPNLTAMDIDSRIRNDSLRLRFDEEKVSSHWVVRLPSRGLDLQEFDIESGVGEIEGVLPGAAIRIELGVGDIELSAPYAQVRRIDLQVGVGDTSIRGGQDGERSRALVSSESSASGGGQHPLRVKAGVGDIRIELE